LGIQAVEPGALNQGLDDGLAFVAAVGGKRRTNPCALRRSALIEKVGGIDASEKAGLFRRTGMTSGTRVSS
jgi:hypothetical protein